MLWVTVLVLGCSKGEAPPGPPVQETAAVPARAATSTEAPSAVEGRPAPTPAAKNIVIDEVVAANPVVVTGRARTFENQVALRVRDADGKLVSEGFTTSVGEMGKHNPYRGTLWLTRDPGSSVTVEALEYSAKDGSEQSKVSVTRRFAVALIAVKLFLPNKDCTGVTPVARTLPRSPAMGRLLVETLLAERSIPFPRQARVRSMNLREGTLTVDFDESLQNVGGSCAVQMIRQSVTQTLQALPSVRRVVITAAGSEERALQP